MCHLIRPTAPHFRGKPFADVIALGRDWTSSGTGAVDRDVPDPGGPEASLTTGLSRGSWRRVISDPLMLQRSAIRWH
jgi:hypothetical protein